MHQPDAMSPTGERIDKTFTGIGDASPANVSRNIAPHIIRQAETRAKARALRDAINAGAMSLEDEAETGEPAPPNPPAQHDAAPAKASPKKKTPGGASTDSANYLYGLMKKGSTDKESLKEWVASLNQKQVSELIEEQQDKEEG
jgi:hypothetical protein